MERLMQAAIVLALSFVVIAGIFVPEPMMLVSAQSTSGEIYKVVADCTTSKGTSLSVEFNSTVTTISVPRYTTVNKLYIYANVSGEIIPSYGSINDYLYGNVSVYKDSVLLKQSSLGFNATYDSSSNVWMINSTCYLYQTLSQEGTYDIVIDFYYLL